MRRLLCVTFACTLFALPTAGAEPLEAVAAQGPSARSVERLPSAYQSLTLADDASNAKAFASQDQSAPGRRLTLGGKSPEHVRSTSRPAAERGAALLSTWAKSSGVTALAALAFVCGLFMLLAWVVKRGMPKSSQILPAEAIRILGRVPLGSRQFGHLLQLGNKLVLVSIQQSGVEKLAEIDDPQEVARMVALCGKSSRGSSQKEFEDIFGQFSKEKTEPGFLGGEASLFSDAGATQAKGGRRYA